MESKYKEFFVDPICEWCDDKEVLYEFDEDTLNFTIQKNDIVVFIICDITKSSVLITDNVTKLQFQLDKMNRKISLHALYYFFGNN